MALPTFFIIGAAKAGTTSLHHYLDQHPQVQMSQNKEPNFFAGPENGIPYHPPRVADREAYEELFDPAVGVRGEASPGYTNHPRRQGVPERIKLLVPQARFVYLVRDPIARTVSHHQDSIATGKQRSSLRAALGNLSDPYLPLLSHSRYATQLELYLEHFPPERLMVVDQADLLLDRRSCLRDIFAHLEVDESFDSAEFDEQLHESSGRRVYSSGHRQLVERLATPAGRWLAPQRRQALRRVLESLLPRLEPPTLEEDLRARLEDLYADEVERLRTLTGKAFPTWSI
jgi:sulfotransferase family protein